MTLRLTGEQVEAYRRDGHVAPVMAIGAEEAAAALARLEAIERARAGRLPPSLNAKPHLLLPWLWDLVHDPRVVDPVTDLIGPDVVCFGTSFIIKNARDGRYVAWHQDATYWGLSSPEAVTAWIALTPSRRENGCVRVVSGSHRTILEHTDSRDPNNLLGRRERLVEDVDETAAVDLALEPGEMSLHDVLVVHGSDRNESDLRRVGFAIRYIPGHVHQTRGRRNSATLVRGTDRGHFERELPPEAEFHPDALARQARALRLGMSIIFVGAGRAPQPQEAAG